MEQTPKISIIVPVYNVEEYLYYCIDSILAQTFTDFELLLIDDGSKDRSGEICDEYAKKDNRIHVFHKENSGVSSARNLGLDKAQGEWICFVDSDDNIEFNYLQTFIHLITVQIADCYVVGCNIIKDNTQKKLGLKDKYYTLEQIKDFIMDSRKVSIFGVPWNKLFKNKIIQKYRIRFDENISSYEDELFVMDYILNIKSILTSSHCTYNYVIRDIVSLSKKYIEINQHIQIADRLYKNGKKISSDSVYLRHLKENFSRHLLKSILCLYYTNNIFDRTKRIKILKRVIETAKTKGVGETLHEQLKRCKFLFFDEYMIDLEGYLLHLWYCLKSNMKRYIKRFKLFINFL